MWLNDEKISDAAINEYRQLLSHSCPSHVVIDGLFNDAKLSEVVKILHQPDHWQIQQHTYSALYVNSSQWQNTPHEQRFVQRDVWRRDAADTTPNAIKQTSDKINSAQEFLSFLRGDEFLSVLSRIFNVSLTDTNVADPEINSNYFRLGATDFVEQHADDSPGREVCLLLYLNKHWSEHSGGELCFNGKGKQGVTPVTISPLFNRCVLFDPSSNGSEHWVKKLNVEQVDPLCYPQYKQFRYNVTSWYWSL